MSLWQLGVQHGARGVVAVHEADLVPGLAQRAHGVHESLALLLAKSQSPITSAVAKCVKVPAHSRPRWNSMVCLQLHDVLRHDADALIPVSMARWYLPTLLAATALSP
jgi:hypothetical protein